MQTLYQNYTLPANMRGMKLNLMAKGGLCQSAVKPERRIVLSFDNDMLGLLPTWLSNFSKVELIFFDQFRLNAVSTDIKP